MHVLHSLTEWEEHEVNSRQPVSTFFFLSLNDIVVDVRNESDQANLFLSCTLRHTTNPLEIPKGKSSPRYQII